MFLSSIQPPEPEVEEGETPPPVEPAPYSLPTLVTSGTEKPYDTFLERSSNIVIGTPGRLASFLLAPRGLSAVKVSNIDVLVLDEADRLVSSPDHRRDVERIIKHLPKQRRTHLFSATMTDAIEDLIGLGLRNPVRIVVNLKDKRNKKEGEERRIPLGLQNTYLVCNLADKTLQLVRNLRREAEKSHKAKFIVYFSTGAAVDYFYRVSIDSQRYAHKQMLSKLPELDHFALTSLHGDLPPRVRDQALKSFTSHPSSHFSPAVLLCTDLASRGVDFSDIDCVVQYDTPTDPKTFSHRVGRTARAGRSGKAILLLSRGREEEYIEFLRVRKIPLAESAPLDEDLEPIPTAEDTEAEAGPSSGQRVLERVDPSSLLLLQQFRDLALQDRDLFDRGARAFVSSVKAYSKHEAGFIFRVAEIDFNALAIAYGLLRLPAMPEVRDWRKRTAKLKERHETMVADLAHPPESSEAKQPDAENKADDKQLAVFVPPVEFAEADLDWNTYSYVSKQREAARQAELVTREANREKDAEERDKRQKKRKIEQELRSAWSNQKERKAARLDRREKRDLKKKREWERKQIEAGEEIERAEVQLKGKKRKEEEEEDWEGDYKALRREVDEERTSRKANKQDNVGGMFDDLD